LSMWGKKNSGKGTGAGGTTLISKSTELQGSVNFSGSLEIEGRVKGNIYAEEGSNARVRIMESGVVEGDISAPTIVINGSVNGDVHSSKHVELAAKATVTGNVHYQVIEVVKGAQVNGSLLYSGNTAKADTTTKLEKKEAKLEVVANT
jgi:cytoskeletal protein CcmA (bactofilin family)